MIVSSSPVGALPSALDKQNDADDYVEDYTMDIQPQNQQQNQLEFTHQQPTAELGATNGNPFTETPYGGKGEDGSDADLNLSERSAQGITPRAPQDQNQVMKANPLTYE